MFNNKKVLIYGGAKGIGRAIAMVFAKRGAQLAIADIDLDGAEDTASTIVESGQSACAIACDVTLDESVAEAASAAEGTLGDIDIVVNNVGVILSGNPEDIPITEWQRILNLNLFPVLRSNDVFLKKMMARGSGHIVNTASLAGMFPYAMNRAPYAASKAAVISLTEQLALYLIPKGVKVSCFCPGPVMTNVMDGMKNWSENLVMCGPGADLSLLTAEQSAEILADGMEAGKIIIPTHEALWGILKDFSQSPDQFIQRKSDEFARGEMGLPGRK